MYLIMSESTTTNTIITKSIYYWLYCCTAVPRPYILRSMNHQLRVLLDVICTATVCTPHVTAVYYIMILLLALVVSFENTPGGDPAFYCCNYVNMTPRGVLKGREAIFTKKKTRIEKTVDVLYHTAVVNGRERRVSRDAWCNLCSLTAAVPTPILEFFCTVRADNRNDFIAFSKHQYHHTTHTNIITTIISEVPVLQTNNSDEVNECPGFLRTLRGAPRHFYWKRSLLALG